MSVAAQAGTEVRVLLVEDDPDDAALVRRILDSSSAIEFRVESVSDLGAARQLLEESPVELVLLDLGLPDAQGLDSFYRLQEWIEEVPFILLTGRAEEDFALSALQQGAEDYLVKGEVDRSGLLRSIRYAIERHRGVRELGRLSQELRRANESLEQLTLIDPLTELLNRRGLQRAISREVQNLGRAPGDVIVLLIDVDDFKRVNDRFGLAVGDVALTEIARRLHASVRQGDYVGRVGGDEFLMILPSSDRAEVTRIAERTRLAIGSTRIHHGEGTVALTASVAALLLTEETPAVDQLLSRAHQLLHQSKSAGKNRVTYEPKEFEDSGSRHRRQDEMCANLTEGQFLSTVRQPIMNLESETPVGWEFLSRYSNGRTEKPDHFFRVCAERNVLTLVDHQCLKSAVRKSMELSEGGRFHMNLFPSTMISIPEDHLVDLFPSGSRTANYCVEISEQQIIGDPSYLMEPVRRLRAAGLKIAIDDVGFGNSCLESLVMLEPDVIKIDKRCVIGLTDDHERIRQLRCYQELARSIGAEVIAEGIERPEELEIVRDVGIGLGQGFLWGRPG